MASMQWNVSEQSLFSGTTMLSARGTIGELGVMPGHVPLLTGINPGVTCVWKTAGRSIYASGGFIEIQPGYVIPLADTAIRAEDLDEAQKRRGNRPNAKWQRKPRRGFRYGRSNDG